MQKIPEYIKKWLNIIDKMKNDNTYKLAWGRAIIECIVSNEYQEYQDDTVVLFDSISECMLKYYWNQQFFFKLKQSPYVDKEPLICKYTKELIDYYVELSKSNIPIWFNKAQEILKDSTEYKTTITKINRVLPENVAYRFMNVPNAIEDIYVLEKGFIKIKTENVKILKEYSTILSKLLNFKWASLLEKFNVSPNIIDKVSGISETNIKRNNLLEYKNALLMQFDEYPIDFYSGKVLCSKDISVDHVIPWSFMYSDDIWNLVLTSRSINSSKSNSIPDEIDIDRLNKQNLIMRDVKDLNDKYKKALDIAIECHYVNKFYNDLKIAVL